MSLAVRIVREARLGHTHNNDGRYSPIGHPHGVTGRAE